MSGQASVRAAGGPLDAVAGGIERFSDAIGRWFAWTTLLLVAVMATNVLLRYLFSVGSVWAQELEWHLMAPICLFGMVYALRHGEHVRVDILYAGYSPRTQALVDLLAALLFLIVSMLVVRYSIPYVLQSWRIDEGSANPGGIPYRYLLKALIPIGFALFLLQSFADAVRAWQRLTARAA